MRIPATDTIRKNAPTKSLSGFINIISFIVIKENLAWLPKPTSRLLLALTD